MAVFFFKLISFFTVSQKDKKDTSGLKMCLFCQKVVNFNNFDPTANVG